jgi:hypothetical protein
LLELFDSVQENTNMNRVSQTAAGRLCLAAILVPIVALSLSGCGEKSDVPETAEASGVVMFKGEPFEGAEVMFHPQDGGNPAHAMTDEDGRFVLTTYDEGDGAVPGEHKVTIMYFPAESLPGMEAETGGSMLPEKYAAIANTPLTAEVKAGEENEFTFELEEE